MQKSSVVVCREFGMWLGRFKHVPRPFQRGREGCLAPTVSAGIQGSVSGLGLRWNCCVSDAATNTRSPSPVTSFQSPGWSVWTVSCPVPTHNRRCESGTPYPTRSSLCLQFASNLVTTAICTSGWYEAKNQQSVFVAATAVAQPQHLQPGHASGPVPVPVPES
jgi:hypothetical protein